jgi:DNA-binding LacI/PurR family transcriptional regulator
MSKVTAQSVANACNTSLAAVSRAFRPDAPIATDLRIAILKTAARLQYAPPSRRVRSKGNVVSFALIVGDIENPFYPLVLREFAAIAHDKRWDMVVLVTPERGSVDSLIAQILQANVDVVVVTSAELSSRLAGICRAKSLPVVMFNRVQVDAGMTAVCTDNYGGGQLAGDRLIDAQRRSIAYIGGRKKTSTHLERRRGLIDALARRQMVLDHDIVCDYSYETALAAGAALFARPTPPDGIFCANDNMGFAMIDAAHQAGLRPGHDVSIIGYDDVPMAGWISYRLTTISQQVPEMVRHTVASMSEVIGVTPKSGQITVVPPMLIARESG